MENENLGTTLKEYSNGKPILELTPLEKIVVNTPTEESYNELMRVYESGGWLSNSLCPPTKLNLWKRYKSRTCVDAGFNIFSSYRGKVYQGKFGIWQGKFKFYQRKNPLMVREKLKTISTNEFYSIQKIIPEKLEKINKYFEERK